MIWATQITCIYVNCDRIACIYTQDFCRIHMEFDSEKSWDRSPDVAAWLGLLSFESWNRLLCSCCIGLYDLFLFLENGCWLIIMYLMEQVQKSNSYFPARLCCHEETELSKSVMTADVFNVWCGICRMNCLGSISRYVCYDNLIM